jgi:phosphoserine phosphatase
VQKAACVAPPRLRRLHLLHAAKFRAVMQELGAKTEHTVAIGDGANDLSMM